MSSAASNNCSPRSSSPSSQVGVGNTANHVGKNVYSRSSAYMDVRHQRSTASHTRKHSAQDSGRGWDLSPSDWSDGFQCVALSISPDLGERLMMSGERSCIIDLFPEISQNLMDPRSGVAWNQDPKHVVRFPLNGYCKMLSLQAISRILSHGFKIAAATGGGVEGQQFCEYLFVRPVQSP